MKQENTRESGVVVVGSANMDIVVSTDHFPAPGETILGKNFGMYPGGKGANQAVCSAKLGSRTYFIGRMGKDVFGDKIVESMRTHGVILDFCRFGEDESTGIAMITLDSSNQNEIVVVSGSNMKLAPLDVEEGAKAFSGSRVVLAQLEIPVDTVIRSAHMAKETGAIFILNPAPARVLPEEIWEYVDYLTPNVPELESLTGLTTRGADSVGQAANRLMERGVRSVIVTMGDKGVLLVDRDGSRAFAARKVNVVDTTAAGDAFNGALAHYLAKSEDIEEAIRFANTAAAMAVTRMGAQSSMPTAGEIHRRFPEMRG